MQKFFAVFSLAILLLSVAPAMAQKKQDSRLVDSGTFGIFLNGRRIGVETFSIQQSSEASVATAELKIDDGNSQSRQTSELAIASNGDLKRYQWRELSPGKAETSVEFKDQFLMERIIPPAGGKPVEIAFMVPPSTVVLDDNFFSQRQILVWRYLAGACGSVVKAPCKLDRGQFGVFIPRQQTTGTVALEYKGKEKIPIRGVERELDRFILLSEGVEWSLWVDPEYKLQRILVPSERVEVLRD